VLHLEQMMKKMSYYIGMIASIIFIIQLVLEYIYDRNNEKVNILQNNLSNILSVFGAIFLFLKIKEWFFTK
jgi:hypothetical protein